MKRKIIVFVTAFSVAFLSIGLSATASSLLEVIRAHLNKEIKFTIDGAPWQPKSGNTVLYPISYNGSTYLPVRAVAEALDVPIQWDAGTKTVHIGGTSDMIPILTESYALLSATITEDAQNRLIHGTDYGQVVWFEKILHSTSRFQLEPAGQYTKLVLKVGIEGDPTRIKLVNVNGPVEFKSVLVTEEDGVVEIQADIRGMQKITVEVMAEEPNSKSSVRIITKDSHYAMD